MSTICCCSAQLQPHDGLPDVCPEADKPETCIDYTEPEETNDGSE